MATYKRIIVTTAYEALFEAAHGKHGMTVRRTKNAVFDNEAAIEIEDTPKNRKIADAMANLFASED